MSKICLSWGAHHVGQFNHWRLRNKEVCLSYRCTEDVPLASNSNFFRRAKVVKIAARGPRVSLSASRFQKRMFTKFCIGQTSERCETCRRNRGSRLSSGSASVEKLIQQSLPPVIDSTASFACSSESEHLAKRQTTETTMQEDERNHGKVPRQAPPISRQPSRTSHTCTININHSVCTCSEIGASVEPTGHVVDFLPKNEDRARVSQNVRSDTQSETERISGKFKSKRNKQT